MLQKLSDLDWEKEEICISAEDRKRLTLPMSVAVGNAI